MPVSVNAGARLDRLPIMAFHRRLLLLIGAGMFLDGFEIYLAGGVVGVLTKSGWATLADGARFVSAGVFGMMIGAYCTGIVGDRFGRRFSYQFNLLAFSLASFAAALAPSMPFLIAARFVMGLGLGAEVVVGYATLVEYVPPESRGRWGAALAVFLNSAVFASALASYLVLPSIGWRWLFVGAGLFGLLVWALRKNLPESPRWLETRGRLAEAEAIVSGLELQAGMARPSEEELHRAFASRPRAGGPVKLFAREMWPRLGVAMALNIGINVAAYGFVVWLPTFLVRQGMTLVHSLGFTMVMSLGGPAGAALGMVFSDRFDRRRLIVVLSLVLAMLGFAYCLASGPATTVGTGFLLLTAFYFLVGVSWACYLPEIFPTEVRLHASGLCNAVGRLAAAGTPFVVVYLFEWHGAVAVVGVITVLLLAQAAVVAALGVEANRRSLEAVGIPGTEPDTARATDDLPGP